MKRRELVRARIDEINPHPFSRLGIQFPSARHERVILEDAAVEHHAVVLPIEHRLHVVRILEILGLQQHVLPVRLGPGLGVFRVHDNGPEHPARDVLNHGRGTAVVEEHPRLLCREREAVRLAGVDGPVIFQEIDFRRMEIHGMGILVRGRVRQGEVDDIAFRNAHHRTGELSVKSPGRVLLTASVDHDIRFDRRHLHFMGFRLGRKDRAGDQPQGQPQQ